MSKGDSSKSGQSQMRPPSQPSGPHSSGNSGSPVSPVLSRLRECDACKSLGFIRYDVPISDERFGKLFPCPECKPAAHYKAERLRRFSRLKGDLLEADFDNWVARPGLDSIVAEVQDWFANGDGWGWLTLSGPHGTGKSHLLAAIVRSAIWAGRPAIYVTTAELLDDLRGTFSPHAKLSYSQLLADLEDAEVLCLDEVEKINPTGWSEEQLFKLFESRYRRLHDTMTVLATNVDLRDKGTLLIQDTRWPGYVEDRLWDARNKVITKFWDVQTFRPVMDVVERGRQHV